MRISRELREELDALRELLGNPNLKIVRLKYEGVDVYQLVERDPETRYNVPWTDLLSYREMKAALKLARKVAGILRERCGSGVLQ